jgi:hypothetical protein
MNRREKVLAYLLQKHGQWVSGYELTHPLVGGSEGLRRLREIRASGVTHIEMRKRVYGDAYEYRIK